MDRQIRERWPRLASLGVVETDTLEVAGGKRRKRERRYHIGSRTDGAQEVQRAVRLHWSIGNPCHWIPDTAFGEDHNQTRTANAAKNLGTMRRIVLNILPDDPGVIKTVPRKRFEALMNIACRERLLSLA